MSVMPMPSRKINQLLMLWSCFFSVPSVQAVTVSPPACASIQKSINKLPASGGEVVVNPGTYQCKTAVVISRNNVRIKGIGFPVLSLTKNANSPVLVVGSIDSASPKIVSNIEISSLIIDGNRGNQTLECWGGSCDTGGLTTIRNSGMVVRAAEKVTIKDVSIKSARSAGFTAEKHSRFITLDKVSAYDNYFDGITAYQTEDSVFSHLFVYDNLAAGFSFDLSFNRNVISDSIVTGNGSVGIFLRDARNNLFQGLQINNSGEHGIFIAENLDTHGAASGNTFSGIFIANSGTASAPKPAGSGIRVNDNSCTNNLLIGSQLIGNEAGGISESSPGLIVNAGSVSR